MNRVILMVCTANVCRSAAAERMLSSVLPAGSGIPVASAGARALVGEPMDPTMAMFLDRAGIHGSSHRGRQLSAEQINDAKLVLTMTRDHRSKVLALVPEAREKTFTLNEFIHLVDGQPRGESLTQISARRTDLAVDLAELDIPDPYNLGAIEYFQAFVQIKTAIEALGVWIMGTPTHLGTVPPPPVTVLDTYDSDDALGDSRLAALDLKVCNRRHLTSEFFSWKAALKSEYDVLHVSATRHLAEDPVRLAKLVTRVEREQIGVVRSDGFGIPEKASTKARELLQQLFAMSDGDLNSAKMTGQQLHIAFAMAAPTTSSR